MKLRYLLSSAILLSVIPAIAGAEEISNFTGMLTAASSTQLGRPVRNNLPQTWTGAEAYPGTNNPTVSFAYQTYTFAASNFIGAPYVEISFFDSNSPAFLSGASLFSSAYAGSYNLNSRAAGWLGDQGASGNYYFGGPGVGDARYYDVVLPVGQNLVIVVNDSSTAALNDLFTIDVSAYADTNYDDPVPTPEPSTFALLGTGLAGIAGAVRGRVSGRAKG